MNGEEYERAIIAKLRTQGCILDEAGCSPVSLAFSFQGIHTFFIPRPPDDGYSVEHLEYIERVFEYLQLELHPLDPWLN